MNAPRVYIGTYRQYNSGSIFGKWFDLCDYANAEEFNEAIKTYHIKELNTFGECEFMAQDWEFIPSNLVNDGYIKDAVFEIIDQLDDDQIEMFFKWVELQGVTIDENTSGSELVEEFQDAFIGHFD